MKKSYLALVCGAASDFPKVKDTMVNQLECRDGRIRMLEDGDDNSPPPEATGWNEYWRREAHASYEVIATSVRREAKVLSTLYSILPLQPKVPLSLIRLELSTGFKHQLRVQLSQYLRSKPDALIHRVRG